MATHTGGTRGDARATVVGLDGDSDRTVVGLDGDSDRTVVGLDGDSDRTVVGLDGDDTLWHSETHFITTTERLSELLAGYTDGSSAAEEHLIEVERRNLARFGYGVKAFTLSMIETAIEVSGTRVTAGEIGQILEWSKDLLDHPVELIDGVSDAVAHLAERHTLLLITKGDLLHQESKVARSGIADHFADVHIVSEKNPSTYAGILSAHGIAPRNFLMAGNSVRSDVLPVLELGAQAVHVPYEVTWALEHAPEGSDPVPVVSKLADLSALLD